MEIFPVLWKKKRKEKKRLFVKFAVTTKQLTRQIEFIEQLGVTMGKRPLDDNEDLAYPSKRQDKPTKAEDAELDPRKNPYLAHHYDQEEDNTNGYNHASKMYSKQSRPDFIGALSKFPRHGTTAKMAAAAEDGPVNPFTGQRLSDEYMRILKTRRELPVHAQR